MSSGLYMHLCYNLKMEEEEERASKALKKVSFVKAFKFASLS